MNIYEPLLTIWKPIGTFGYLIYSYCYNTTPNSAHAYSPFEILFGKPIHKFESIDWSTIDPLYNYDSYLHELKHKLQVIHAYIHKKIEQTKATRTQSINNSIIPTNLNLNDTVYLKAEGRRKLDNVQIRPYRITNLSESNAEIQHQITNQTIIVHKTRLVKQKNCWKKCKAIFQKTRNMETTAIKCNIFLS